MLSLLRQERSGFRSHEKTTHFTIKKGPTFREVEKGNQSQSGSVPPFSSTPVEPTVSGFNGVPSGCWIRRSKEAGRRTGVRVTEVSFEVD